MPTLNNTKNQTSSKDNWSDNLLIKDKGGKLHHLNSSNKDKNVVRLLKEILFGIEFFFRILFSKKRI